MHESKVAISNQKKSVSARCVVENVENLEKDVVNNLNVSGIDCVNKPSSETCGVEASKTHVGVKSYKHSSVRSEEEISDEFVNQVLFEFVAFVINDIDKNLEVGLGSSSRAFEKTANVIPEVQMEVSTLENVALPQDNTGRQKNVEDDAPTSPVFHKSGDDV
ncbi:unnamed protein product [Citrullus colocynthis]|uniref:Uncharacterized protein n=1 Tax=Citrullus colocynthis TaxID=252529 RepID=A0ABP0XUL1_9ROSI